MRLNSDCFSLRSTTNEQSPKLPTMFLISASLFVVRFGHFLLSLNKIWLTSFFYSFMFISASLIVQFDSNVEMCFLPYSYRCLPSWVLEKIKIHHFDHRLRFMIPRRRWRPCCSLLAGLRRGPRNDVTTGVLLKPPSNARVATCVVNIPDGPLLRRFGVFFFK